MSRGMRYLLLALGAVAVIGAAFSAYTLRRESLPPADVAVIAHGEEVRLEDHAVQGKYTVFDFYAVWCPPCRTLSPALERLARNRLADLAIRKIDVVDWTMPVVRQHGIESLPHLVLFDRQARRVAEGEEVFAALLDIFGEAAREVANATDFEQQQPPIGTTTEEQKHLM